MLEKCIILKQNIYIILLFLIYIIIKIPTVVYPRYFCKATVGGSVQKLEKLLLWFVLLMQCIYTKTSTNIGALNFAHNILQIPSIGLTGNGVVILAMDPSSCLVPETIARSFCNPEIWVRFPEFYGI